MAEIEQSFIRQFVGKPVRLAVAGGPVLDGHLLSFDGRSLWVVVDGDDRFVPVAQVADVSAPLPVAG